MFLDGSKEIEKHGGKLPHWQQGEVMQFVTFRLADAMPKVKLRIWAEERKNWLGWNPEPWTEEVEKEYHQRFTKKLEDWLDAGEGACLLKEPECRDVLVETLMRDEGTRVRHEAWVIMPNHVHLLFSPMWPLEKLMKTWKGVSARRIGKGSIWQKNYRDTMIRDSRHFANAVRYIRKNPAKLRAGEFALWESERAQAIK
ncbi:MAG: transposase [Akkermansiaceae bacterium]|jgi:putative transposase|nr:transposase [Akkermansiaceae bacterium]MDP4646700.1 transposase [Akkermansiaceae bacterium]MDP4721090.1 transposase [Akkermansiaceae bacterium]MDP4779616.1 transposase [Akkermansiaceae bacterium]MDP4846304.1 transposase [Akkermansiaceae bacterium]